MEPYGFKGLNVWQKSLDLTEKVYYITNRFPKDEKYILTSQMRRSSLSIISNIAEGNKRGSTKEYKYFLDIAKGSLAELEAQFIFAQRIKLLEDQTFEEVSKEMIVIAKMLSGLKASLNQRANS